LGLSLDAVRRELLSLLGGSGESIEDAHVPPGLSPEPVPVTLQHDLDYTRLTAQVRDVIRLASCEATRVNHEFIAPEHILFGVLMQSSGAALEALENLGVDPRKIRLQLETLLQPGPQIVFGGRNRPPTPETKAILRYAFEESRNLQHNYVGTEHLLLGLLRDQGTRAEVLLNFFGLTLEKTRREIRKLAPPSPKEDSSSSELIPDLPEDVRQKITELAAQIDQLNEEKEQAVADQDFERAAHLRDQADKIKKQRAEILRQRQR
jgi:ATP-dependent Clp protease ATP-binding subunit ClpA